MLIVCNLTRNGLVEQLHLGQDKPLAPWGQFCKE